MSEARDIPLTAAVAPLPLTAPWGGVADHAVSVIQSLVVVFACACMAATDAKYTRLASTSVPFIDATDSTVEGPCWYLPMR